MKLVQMVKTVQTWLLGEVTQNVRVQYQDLVKLVKMVKTVQTWLLGEVTENVCVQYQDLVKVSPNGEDSPNLGACIFRVTQKIRPQQQDLVKLVQMQSKHGYVVKISTAQ